MNCVPTRRKAACTDFAVFLLRIHHNSLLGTGHTAKINLDAAGILYEKHEILIILCTQAVPGAAADAIRIDYHVEKKPVFRPEITEAAESTL